MGVLLLNASYEAIRIVSMKRAVVLVLQEKAEIVEHGDTEIRSANFSMPQPEVIRLKYYVKIPYRSRVPLSNRAVMNRDKFRCAYCGKRASTVDHVHPKAKGGRHEWTNCVAACKACNSKKADKTLDQLGWELPFDPQPPSAKTWLVVASPEKMEAWNTYLSVV